MAPARRLGAVLVALMCRAALGTLSGGAFDASQRVRVIELDSVASLRSSFEYDVLIVRVNATTQRFQRAALFNGSRSVLELQHILAEDLLRDVVSLDCASGERFQIQAGPPSSGTLLLPQLAAHSGIALSSFALHQARRAGMSTALLEGLLAVAVRSAKASDSSELRNKARRATSSLAGGCELRVKPPFLQSGWPLVQLLDNAQRPISGRFAVDALPRAAPTVFVHSPRRKQCGSGDRASASAARLPASSSPAIVSLIQVRAMEKFISAGLKAVVDPLLSAIMGYVGRHIEGDFLAEVVSTCLERTPPQVLQLAEIPMRTNTSHLIVDAVTLHTNRFLGSSLTNSLGPPIAEKLVDMVLPALHQELHKILTVVVSRDLNNAIPQNLERTVRQDLSSRLTFSLTHALTGSVTQALSQMRDPRNGQYCHECHFFGRHCQLCRSSVAFNYYTTYYSAYYADYFQAYYGKYYTDVVKRIDRQRDPLQQQGAPEA